MQSLKWSKYHIDKTWKVIKSMINKDYSTDALNEIKINTNSTTAKKTIADSLITTL